MYYEIDKNTGVVNLIESSIMHVSQWKELITYFKVRAFPKLGFYYFRIIILMYSPRSPYNRAYFTDDQKLEKSIRAVSRAMLAESTSPSIKPPDIDLKILKSPLFNAAVEEYKILDRDVVFEEFINLEKRLLQYNQTIHEKEITLENADDYKKFIAVGEAITSRLEQIRKEMFEISKSKENKFKGSGKTTSDILSKL